jgi:CO/xanthine dehydrogenase Mo-binding subunit
MDRPPLSAAELPQSLLDNPPLHAWFDLGASGILTLLTGKVEIGQGIVRALRRIAAEELDLREDQVEVVSGDTAVSPYEWFTAGSMSIEVAGQSVRLAAAELRARLFAACASRLKLEAAQLAADAGRFHAGGEPTGESYWSVAGAVDMHAPVTGLAPCKPAGAYHLVGEDAPREDLRAKVAGAPYIHDFCAPGMLHGRVLRKPSRAAELLSLDAGRVTSLPGVFQLVQDRHFLGVLCEEEYVATLALERLERAATWSEPPPGRHANARATDYFELLPAHPTVLSDACAGADWSDDAAGTIHRAEYSRPLLAHGSIGPACAIAAWDRSGIRVWTHSQGVFALRDQIARVTGVPPRQVQVQHLPGAGCYGHTGADDAALDAVMLARQAEGRPVRTLWRRIDELRHEPLGSPMKVRVAAALDASGAVTQWKLDAWSGAFAQRPGWNGGVNLHAAADGAGAFTFAEPKDLPAHNGGSKNACANYTFAQSVTHHMVAGLPFRLSALRSLGAFANVFAIESFMDELAEASGQDRLAFRLRHLEDPRARRVLEEAAAMANWKAGPEPGRYLGLAQARFKNKGAYCAIVAEVSADQDIALTRVWAAIEAGLAVSPDDIRAQTEGGILMAASWTLHEAMPTEGPRITAESWLDYPILRFSDVPEIEVRVLSDPAQPSLGVGEAALGPAAGAIGNAVASALGMRLRDLPLTRERIMNAMLA